MIGRNAVLRYKGRQARQAEIASELGATYMVDGSIKASKERVRISAQLTDADAATVLWSDRYDGELSDIFEFQDSIARHIAGTLAANISQVEVRRHFKEARPDQNAFDLLLRARAVGHASSRTANRQVRELMTKAIELDPNYATTHALLAEAIYSQVVQGWTEFPDRELARAEELARRAIALAPDEPDGHRVLGRILLIRTEYDQARNALERAIDINPSDANALAVQGALQSFNGDLPGAIESLELALKYDPMLQPNSISISPLPTISHADTKTPCVSPNVGFPGFRISRCSMSRLQRQRHSSGPGAGGPLRRRNTATMPQLDIIVLAHASEIRPIRRI